MALITIHKTKSEIYISSSDLFAEPQDHVFKDLSSSIECLKDTLKTMHSTWTPVNFTEFVFLQLPDSLPVAQVRIVGIPPYSNIQPYSQALPSLHSDYLGSEWISQSS